MSTQHGTAFDADADVEDGLWVDAVVAGITAGVVFGVLIQGLMGRMVAIGAMYTLGDPSLVVGWIAHVAHSAIFGLVFAVIVARDPFTGYLSDVFSGALLGTGYAFVLWFVNIGVVWPLWLNAVAFGNLPFPNWASPMPLVGHLVWGLLLGGVLALLQSRRR